MVVAYIKRYDADGIAGHEERAVLHIVEREGEDAGETLEERRERRALGGGLPFTVQGEDDLTVGTRLILIFLGRGADVLMVVDLTIDGEHLLLVGGEEGLTAALGVNDGQTLVAQDGRGAGIDAAPVGTAVTYLLTHAERFLTQLRRLLLNIEYSNYSTHNLFLY